MSIPQSVLDIVPTDRYYPFISNSPDKVRPELHWFVFGLLDTNEIMVVVAEGDNILGKLRKPSPLVMPIMEDRKWGIAIEDNALAEQMSNELAQELGL